MNQRTLLLAALFLGALATTWLLRHLAGEGAGGTEAVYHDPDYYMEDFTTVTMEEDGTPKNRLYAVYMAHYPDDDTTELLKPEMQLYRENREPLFIRAEKGWVTSGNEVVLLSGGVRMWEDDAGGRRTLQVDTSEARVLINEDYAETDMPATIVSKRSTITGTGMRAWFTEGRLEVLDHELTIIEQGPGG